MAVVIDQIDVAATAPPAQTRSGSGGGSDTGQGPGPEDIRKEIEKTLRIRESRIRRLWTY